jgi:hypothetical protein
MTTTNKKTSLPTAILKLPTQVELLVTYAENVVTRMTGNPAFTTPVPSLALVTAATGALHLAQTAVQARTKGTVAIRDEKRTALITLLKQLRGYVQSTADATPDNAVSIIESSGLAVRKTAVRKPRVFEALPGAVSGSAKLVAPSAGQRASYEWEYSTDGGKTWVTMPPTLQAKTSVTGLTPGSSVQFRYRAVLKAGAGDWSLPITLPSVK